jgi:hypothetical protein
MNYYSMLGHCTKPPRSWQADKQPQSKQAREERWHPTSNETIRVDHVNHTWSPPLSLYPNAVSIFAKLTCRPRQPLVSLLASTAPHLLDLPNRPGPERRALFQGDVHQSTPSSLARKPSLQ